MIKTIIKANDINHRYNCMNEQLLEDRVMRHELAQDYSKIRRTGNSPGDEQLITISDFFNKRYEFLKQIFGKIHDNEIYIEPPFNIDYGYNIEIGTKFYANFNMTILDCSIVKIGNDVQFGPNVVLSCATHSIDPIQRCDEFVEWAREIIIGDKVWLGANVTVLPGVTIGEGTTVGANSVVTKDLPSNCVAVGTPARVIKKLSGYKE